MKDKKKRNRVKVERLFYAIAKVGYNQQTKQNICVKYRTNKPQNCADFLQKKFPNVCWINFFHRVGEDKGKLCWTWGSKKGLQLPY